MARRRPRGWFYPWLFVGGMLIVVLVNGVLIAYAVSTFPGLTTQDAYRKGLAYNRTLAAAEAQAARGWRLELTLAPGDGGRAGAADGDEGAPTGQPAILVGRFTDRDGRPLDGLKVAAILERPVGTRGSIEVELAPAGGGLYRTPLALPEAGQWQVRVHARRGEETFQEARRFVVR